MADPVVGTIPRFPDHIFGTMARRDASPAARKALFGHALERGIRAFDTAPLYDFGATEIQLGEVLAGQSAEIQVYSKVGLSWRPDSRGPVHFETTDLDGGRRIVHRDSRPLAIRLDVEESLARLGRRRLDLVQVHFRDSETAIPDTMQALAELHSEGKVGAIGVSNFSLSEVREAAAALDPLPLAAVQIRLNLLQREPLAVKDIVPWCRERGIAVLAYSPLAEGRLARPPQTINSAVDGALADLANLADREGRSMASLAIGWLLRQPGVNSTIVGASSPAQLDASLAVNTIEDALLDSITGRFAGVRLIDAWEGPGWKRKLRALKQRLLGQ